ncbi:MAG TPA: patatin-like phospholipase family protein [Gammaproteobacteria bacterium]|nr:patatin-like phospholipase family protein [Gammaproteobacteria bacterium]
MRKLMSLIMFPSVFQSVCRKVRCGLGLAVAMVMFSGCAHFEINEPATDLPQLPAASSGTRADDLLVVLTFSGGGARASALSYGVLESLAQKTIRWHGRDRRLLDEVDLISGVSGGSFTAAYFGLFGDRIFEVFKPEFLNRDVDGELIGKLFSPVNWMRLWSPYYDRSELSTDLYNDVLFHHTTFGDFAKSPGPDILINATDMTLGDGFTFDALHFRLICSDLANFPVARAVMASSAVPGIFSPVTLFNYAGTCGYQEPGWVEGALHRSLGEDERSGLARKIRAYQDLLQRPYIHLLDGGLADNLGLRAILDRVRFYHAGIGAPQSHLLNQDLAKILVVVVNAAASPSTDLNRRKNPPSVIDSVDVATTIQVNRYNDETLQLFKRSVEEWREAMRVLRCGDEHCEAEPEFFLVDASLSQVKDRKQRRFLQTQPTSFSLSPEAVEGLVSAGKQLLDESEGMAEFLRSF